jgi:hypothetical protein
MHDVSDPFKSNIFTGKDLIPFKYGGKINKRFY